MKDGSFLVSDEYDGAVYRITHGEGGATHRGANRRLRATGEIDHNGGEEARA